MAPFSTNFRNSDKADSLEKFFPLNPLTPSSVKVSVSVSPNVLQNDSAAEVCLLVESPDFCFVELNL